jgi:hypothetical protein
MFVELIFYDTQGNPLDYDFCWANATVVLKGTFGRQKSVKVLFPGDSTPDVPRLEEGMAIWDFVDQQLGTEFDLKVIRNGVIPCWEDFSFIERYEDVEIKVFLIGELPAVKPVEHRFERNLNFRQRRNQKLWEEWAKEKEQYVTSSLHQSLEYCS